jgi:uncharacterized protein
MNVVVDTSVLVSAALRDRLPESVLLWIVGKPDWSWVITGVIVAEYLDVLPRPKTALPPAVIEKWVRIILRDSICIAAPAIATLPSDPADA